MSPRRELRWLTREQVEAIHQAQLEQHGGLPGLRDAGALESALGRPRFRWSYGEARDVADSAAAYGFALAKNHAFADGNKRTAFVAMVTFFECNGWLLAASEAEVVALMLGVADGRIPERALAGWLRENGTRLAKRRSRRRSPRRRR